MQSDSLKDKLAGKYIICVCEGNAEEAIIELLLGHDLLCFKREDLIGKACTQIRRGDRLAEEYLNQAYERNIAILRIQDREKEKLKFPKSYKDRIPAVYDVITKPEIEILHIIAHNWEDDFDCEKRRQHKLKASGYCKAKFQYRDVKTKEFIERMYANNIDGLVYAIERYCSITQQKCYSLKDLLI